MRISSALLVLQVVAFGGTAWAGHRSAEEARPRIEHHLQQVDLLSQHFAGLLRQNCQRFDRPDEWRTFLDGELDRATLVDRAQRLVTKLQACAGDNGTSFDAAAAWQRVERDVPRRQAEIALPQ